MNLDEIYKWLDEKLLAYLPLFTDITIGTIQLSLSNQCTSTDPVIVILAQTINWYIMPVSNVDGFVYSHNVVSSNRNFPFNWMINNGASDNPCSSSFAGPAPFSEPEVLALSNFVNEHASEIQIYISFDSYGQYIIFPFGHSSEPAPNHDILVILLILYIYTSI